jgi:hypothetical protein
MPPAILDDGPVDPYSGCPMKLAPASIALTVLGTLACGDSAGQGAPAQ